jgi:3-oxoacyl-[acyl-carrier protein] reductase
MMRTSRRWRALVRLTFSINNAGVAGFGNPLTMDFAAVEEELAVNYLGVPSVTRSVAPGMIARRDGMIVNIATLCKVNLPIVGRIARPRRRWCRWARRSGLSFEHNVRVITVLPTTIDTDMSKGADVPKMTKELRGRGDPRRDSRRAPRSADWR